MGSDSTKEKQFPHDAKRRQKICGRRWKAAPDPRSQEEMGLHWGWDTLKQGTAVHLARSSLRSSAAQRYGFRVGFLSKLWIITYPAEMWDSKLMNLMEWKNSVVKQWERNSNMATVGTAHLHLVHLYSVIQF